jgi:hypothetical protein
MPTADEWRTRLPWVAFSISENDARQEVDRRGLLNQTNEPIPHKKMTVHELIRLYSEHELPKLTESTQSTHRHNFKEFVFSLDGESSRSKMCACWL